MGLIELLIAMVVLNVAVLATVAAFSSGMLALNRAGRQATAAVLADVELERLRAIRYCDIRLDSSMLEATTPPYSTDPSNSGAPVPAAACDTGPNEAATPAVAIRSGADGRTYRVDTFMALETPSAGGRQLKRVTVVVRGPAPSLRTLTRQTSTFDRATG